MFTKYYVESKGEKISEARDENKYNKWKVESAYRTLVEVQEILKDTKMMGYVKLYMQHQAVELKENAKKLGAEAKVGKKLKELFNG